MRGRSIVLLVSGLLVGALATGGWQGEAKPAKPKKVRAEVAQLRAKVVQLESQLGVLARLDTSPGVVSPGGFFCGDPCAGDADEDGIGDCEDPCPCVAGTPDADGDGTPDCYDPCPDDATDACIDPCRMDSDGDGSVDCDDPCPWDPASAQDRDGDDVPDCQDPCPDDASNQCFGPCPPLDQDGDGTRDCTDPCPWGETTGMPCAWKGGGGVAAQRAAAR
jgi:hypothetical protein